MSFCLGEGWRLRIIVSKVLFCVLDCRKELKVEKGGGLYRSLEGKGASVSFANF